MKNSENALFYTCSLIEYIARITKNERSLVVNLMGKDVERVYNFQDVFHCEPIEKVADDFIRRDNIPMGDYDNVQLCKYEAPDYWDIGEVFARLLSDCYAENEIFKGIREVYNSWFARKILNFNSDLYYQPREYLAACYKLGHIIAA